MASLESMVELHTTSRRTWQDTLYWALCGFVLVCSALLSGYRSGEPAWDNGYHAFVQSEYPHNALNYLRYGYLETRFAPVMNNGNPDPPSPIKYRFSHGPVTALLISLSYRILGVSDFSARLVPILCAVGVVGLTFAITLRLSHDRRLALIALLFCGLIPMQTFYARMPGPHMVAVLFILLAIYSYCRWLEHGQPGALVGIFVALIIGLWTDWIAYAIGPILATHYLIVMRAPRRWWFVVALASTTVGMAIVYAIWVVIVGGDPAVKELTAELLFRVSTGTELTTMPISSFTLLLLRRSAYWLTLPIVALVLVWVALILHGLIRRSVNSLRVMTLTLLGIGLAHDFLLRNRSIYHDFIMLYHLVPACAIAAADALMSLSGRLRNRWRLVVLPLVGVILTGFTWQAVNVFEAAHRVTLENDRASYGIGRLISNSIPETSRFINLAAPTWPMIDSAADRAYETPKRIKELIREIELGQSELVLVRNDKLNDPEIVDYLIAHFPRRDAYGYSAFFLKQAESAIPVFGSEAHPEHAAQITFGGQIEFLGYDAVPVVHRSSPAPWLERYFVRSPEMLPDRETTFRVTAYWRKIAEVPAPLVLNLRFVSSWGQPYTLAYQYAGLNRLYPVAQWPTGQIVRDVFDIEVPADAPDGRYVARVGVTSADVPLPPVMPAGERFKIGPDLGVNLGIAVDVRSPTSVATSVANARPQHSAVREVAGFVNLSGYDLETQGAALRIKTYWATHPDTNRDSRLLLRLQGGDMIRDRIINLPPPRLWGHTDTIVVETLFPETLPSDTYTLSLVVANPDEVVREEPLGEVVWCSPSSQKVVLASLAAWRNMPGDIRLGISSPVNIQFELREPQDVELLIAWTGLSPNNQTLIDAAVRNADGSAQSVETHLVRSQEPGSFTIAIPRHRTRAGANTLIITTPDTIQSPSLTDTATMVAVLQENLSRHRGWIDLEVVQVRLREEIGPSSLLTVAQSLAMMHMLQRVPTCFQPDVHQQLMGTVLEQIMAEDKAVISNTELSQVGHLAGGVLRDRVHAVLYSQIGKRLDHLIYVGDTPAIRLLGYTIMTEEDRAGSQIDVFFESLDQRTQDYIVFMHGYPKPGIILPAESVPYGHTNWDSTPTIPSSAWRVGNIYVSSHAIPVSVEQYEIVFGLWDPVTGQVLMTESLDSTAVR